MQHLTVHDRSRDPGGRFWKSLEKDIMCSTFTGGIYNQSGLETSRSPRADEWTDTTLSTAFENTIQIGEMEKNICLSDIRYFQTYSISDGEYLGDLLDKWLQLDFSKYYWELKVFERFGRYYTEECKRLWALKNLKRFRKSPKIEFSFTHPPFQKMDDSIHFNSFSDSIRLRPNALIGGSILILIHIF